MPVEQLSDINKRGQQEINGYDTEADNGETPVQEASQAILPQAYTFWKPQRFLGDVNQKKSSGQP
jgi:tRNA G18 (ribose-2'-O)-methylase SpoU